MTKSNFLKLQVLIKTAKIRDVKMLKNDSITTRNYALISYQILEKILLRPRAEKLEKEKKSNKLVKKCKK